MITNRVRVSSVKLFLDQIPEKLSSLGSQILMMSIVMPNNCILMKKLIQKTCIWLIQVE